MKNIIKVLESSVTVKKGSLFLWAMTGFFTGCVFSFMIFLMCILS